MNTLIADQSMLARLGMIKELTEIRDTGGRVIGFYAPAMLARASDAVNRAARVDPEELDRRERAGGPAATTREVFEHLLSLTSDDPTRACLQRVIEDLKERDRCVTP